MPETWGNGNVLKANINQRHMTKKQLAMAVAIIYPEAQKLRRKGSSPFVTERLKSERVPLVPAPHA